MSTQDDACLLCHNEIYLNPTMKLMMAVCGHKFCESCVTLTFLKSVAMNCPECHTQLKKNSFILQSSDDSALQKENSIRKRILKIYNKRREDFPNLTEYNDYLEIVEDIIFNLVNNIDVESTNEKVKRYAAENQQSIFFNQSKKATEDRVMALQILEEEKNFQERKKQHIFEDQQEAQQRLQERLNIGQNGTQKGTTKQAKKKEEPAPAAVAAPPTITAPANQPLQYRPAQPQQPTMAQPQQPPPQQALLAQPSAKPSAPSGPVDMQTRERAGGFKQEYIRARALEEAFSALWVPPSTDASSNNSNHPLSLPSLSPMKLT